MRRTQYQRFFHSYRLIITATLSIGSTTAFAWCAPYMVGTVNAVFISAQTALMEMINQLRTAAGNQMVVDSEKSTAAIAILTKQKALSAQKIVQAQQKSAQVSAQALNTLQQFERIKQARFDYGPEFGQGYNVCKTAATRNLLEKKWQQLDTSTTQNIQAELDAKPGAYGNTNAVKEQRLSHFLDKYCSQDQVKAGLCAKVGAQAAQASQITTLFQNSQKGDAVDQAKNDLINVLVGAPDDTLNANASSATANTIAQQNYHLLKMQKDALIAPAVFTLKHVQNMYTKQNNTSPMELLAYETKRYMGTGADGMAWHQAMAIQNERGLLIELLKMKSLDLAIQHKQYQQQQRTEWLLANLLASEAQKTQKAQAENP